MGNWICGRPAATQTRFYCQNTPGLTAIPPDLLDDARRLEYLYGRPRPNMGHGRPATQAQRSTTTFSNRIALSLPACSDRLVSALCRDANRVLPRTPVYALCLHCRRLVDRKSVCNLSIADA